MSGAFELFQLGAEALAAEFRKGNPAAGGLLAEEAPVLVGQKHGDLLANVGGGGWARLREAAGSAPAAFDGDGPIGDDTGEVTWRRDLFFGGCLSWRNGVGEAEFVVKQGGVVFGFARVFRGDADFTNHGVASGMLKMLGRE